MQVRAFERSIPLRTKTIIIYRLKAARVHIRLVNVYLLNVPRVSSPYFNKIKRTSHLGKWHALSLEILMLPGPKVTPPRDHMFYIALYRETWKNLLVWNHKTQNLDIWYVAPRSGPLTSCFFKLYPWGQQWARPVGHMFYIGLYRENMKRVFLSETTRPRALMFGMKPWYLVCSIT